MPAISATTDLAGYSADRPDRNDHYSENQRSVGHWRGLGAAMLGLCCEAKHDDFEAVRQGNHPGGGFIFASAIAINIKATLPFAQQHSNSQNPVVLLNPDKGDNKCSPYVQ